MRDDRLHAYQQNRAGQGDDACQKLESLVPRNPRKESQHPFAAAKLQPRLLSEIMGIAPEPGIESAEHHELYPEVRISERDQPGLNEDFYEFPEGAALFRLAQWVRTLFIQP